MNNIILAIAIFLSTPDLAKEAPNTIKKCQTCHGKQLTGKKKNPAILGLSYERVYASITTDVPKKMKRVAKRLTEEEKNILARYIATLESGESR